MPAPWEKYGGTTQPAPPVVGDPIVRAAPTAPAPTPLQLEDQEMDRERLRLAQQAAARAAAGEQRAATTDAMGSESERTAGFLAGRVVNAVQRLSQAAKADPSASAPSLGVEAVRNIAGNSAANYITDPQHQQVRAAQIDILDAALTLGTGAAYTKEQLEGYREGYFPALGDDPSTIAAKRQALRSLIVNAQTKAGRAAPDIAGALAALDALETPQSDSAALPGGTDDSAEGLVGGVSYEGPNPANGPNIGPDGKPRVTGNDPGYAQFAAGLGNIVEGGVNNTIGLIATPINATINSAFGTNLETNLGAQLRQAMGLPYTDETTDAVQQALTGGISVAGAARAAGGRVAGMTGNALTEYGARPVMDGVTGGTAAFSGEMARQAGAGPVGQAAAILAGGAAPNALTGLRSAAGRAPADLDRGVVAAGQRAGVPVRLADAVPSRRGEVANLETSQRGGPIIQQGRAADSALIEQRVGDLGGEGAPLEPYALGQKVQRAGKGYIDRTRNQKNDLYTKAEQLAGGQRVVPDRAIAAVDQNIAELRASGEEANSAAISYLQGLRKDLSKPEGFSITEFQALRSSNRAKIKGDNALTSSDADRRLGNVVKEFTADATDQLPDAASSALDQADTFYAQRQDYIGTVLKNLLGTKNSPVPAERAAERLMAMTKGKGDYEKFARVWNELPPADRADTAATLAYGLGRKANGEFSPATLVKSLDPRTGINPRTARLIFGEDGARALSDLRVLSRAKTDVANSLNNSRTGTVVQRAAGGLKTLIMGGLGFSAGGPAGAIAAPIARDLMSKWGEERAARALMNPDFTKMLRQMPETTNAKVIDSYFKRMTVQAAKSPILANDVRSFQEALKSAANDNASLVRGAAASGNDETQQEDERP